MSPRRLVFVVALASFAACQDDPPAPCAPPGTQVTAPRAAGCLAVHEGALLVVRTREGWSIPGGYVEDGETSAEAAVRETREEAGVVVGAGPAYCAVASKAFVAHRCRVVSPRPEPRPDAVESFEARWMDAAALRALQEDMLRFPAQRDAYLRALRP